MALGQGPVIRHTAREAERHGDETGKYGWQAEPQEIAHLEPAHLAQMLQYIVIIERFSLGVTPTSILVLFHYNQANLNKKTSRQ